MITLITFTTMTMILDQQRMSIGSGLLIGMIQIIGVVVLDYLS